MPARTGCRARSRRYAPEPLPEPRIRVVPVHGAEAAGAILGGLDPRRLAPPALAASLGALGAHAGNGAVAELVARVRTDMPQDPPEGIRAIRRVGAGGQLGHTRTYIYPTPPLLRLAPETAEGGAAVRAARATPRELDFEVRYPTPGRHLLYEGTTAEGQPARIWLEIGQDWADTIRRGEEEHVADQSIAWRDTWGRIAGVINDMADRPPITAPSPDDARRAAWRQFADALPAPLRPEGDDPSEAAQLAKWGSEDASTVFRHLIGESKRARDNSAWHTPDASLDHMEGPDEVRVVSAGSSQIGRTSPEDLMQAAWNRLGGQAGGGSGGARGRRRGRR